MDSTKFRFLPVIVIKPQGAIAGVMLIIAGVVAALMASLSDETTLVPFTVSNVTDPVPEQVVGTITSNEVAPEAGVTATDPPKKVTLRTKSRSVPVIVTLSPAVNANGLILVNAGFTIVNAAVVAVKPELVLSTTAPSTAVSGTVTSILVADWAAIVPSTPELKVTFLTKSRFV